MRNESIFPLLCFLLWFSINVVEAEDFAAMNNIPYNYIGNKDFLSDSSSERVLSPKLLMNNSILYVSTTNGSFYSFINSKWEKSKPLNMDDSTASVQCNTLIGSDMVFDKNGTVYVSAQDGIVDHIEWLLAKDQEKTRFECGPGKGRIALLKYSLPNGWDFMTKRGEGIFPARYNGQLLINNQGELFSTSASITNPPSLVIQKFSAGKLSLWGGNILFPRHSIVRFTKEDRMVIGYVDLKEQKLQVKIYDQGKWSNIGNTMVKLSDHSEIYSLAIDAKDNIYIAFSNYKCANNKNSDKDCQQLIHTLKWSDAKWTYVGSEIPSYSQYKFNLHIDINGNIYASLLGILNDGQKVKDDKTKTNINNINVLRLVNDKWVKIINIPTYDEYTNSIVSDKNGNVYLLISEKLKNYSVVQVKKDDIDQYLDAFSPQSK